MNYGIAIFPPRKIQDMANSYRKRYDPRYSLVPPHITLKSSFKLRGRDLDEITAQLEAVAADTSAFQIEFHKVSTFHPTTSVIYLAIKNGQPLVDLHERCNQDLLYDEEPYTYVPHLTIAQDLSKAELQDIYGSLRMTEINETAAIDRFHLLYQMENDMWTVYQTFLLQE